jgi:MFS family permease
MPARAGLLASFSRIPGNVKWLVCLILPSAVVYGYLLVLISAYLPEIGLTPGDVGLIIGATGATFVISAIPLGMLSDRKGRKPVFFFGLLVLPPSLLVFALTTEVMYLVAAAIVAGVAEGAYLTTWNAIIADQTTTENRDAAFSLSFILGNFAFGLGFAIPILFPSIQGVTGLDSRTIHNGALILLVLLALASPAALWRLLRDYKETVTPRRTQPGSRKLRPPLKLPTLKRIINRLTDFRLKMRKMGLLLKFSMVNSLIGLGAGFIIPLIPTWLLLKFSVPDTLSGPLLAVANVTIALAAVASASISRRYGQVRAIVLTQGLSMGFMLSLAFVPTAVLAGAVYLVRTALMNMSSPLADSFLMGIVSKEDRGLASAINSLFWRLPNSATTVIGGLILASGDYDLPIFIAAGFYVVGISLFYLVFRNVKPRG